MKFFMSALLVPLILASFASAAVLKPSAPKPGPDYYRNLTMKIRPSGDFIVPFPGADQHFDYKFEFAAPVYKEPMIGDYALDPEHPQSTIRYFWDRIMLMDGSRVVLNGQEVPLTCIFVQGQDNRWLAGPPNPLFPDIVMKITLVANDFQCVGPINPNWPQNGGRKENWDTFVKYTVKDPTIMLPMDAELRYRWNEYQAVLVK